MLINPGAFSLYWAPLIRKIVPSYLGETFFGVPVTLGDDTALTLYALLHGRAVHQPSAVSLPVYPETVAHHLRQWTRWMRASTIRMIWRLRYLPVHSYGWIFTVYTIGSFLFSVAMTIVIPLVWPASVKLLLASIAAMVIWPLSISLRLATVRRSDQGVFSRLFGIALLPIAALWYVLVLRQIRFYGIATCWRQGWVTRQHVEVRLDGGHEPVPGHAPSADAAAERGQAVPHVALTTGVQAIREVPAIRRLSGSATVPGTPAPSPIAAHRVGGWRAAAATGRTSCPSWTHVMLATFRQRASSRSISKPAGLNRTRMAARMAGSRGRPRLLKAMARTLTSAAAARARWRLIISQVRGSPCPAVDPGDPCQLRTLAPGISGPLRNPETRAAAATVSIRAATRTSDPHQRRWSLGGPGSDLARPARGSRSAYPRTPAAP